MSSKNKFSQCIRAGCYRGNKKKGRGNNHKGVKNNNKPKDNSNNEKSNNNVGEGKKERRKVKFP